VRVDCEVLLDRRLRLWDVAEDEMPSAAVAFRAFFACPLLEPNASDCTHCTVRCSDLTVSRDSLRRASGVSLVLRLALALALLRARGGSLASPSSSSLSRWRLQEGSSSTGGAGDSDGIEHGVWARQTPAL